MQKPGSGGVGLFVDLFADTEFSMCGKLSMYKVLIVKIV